MEKPNELVTIYSTPKSSEIAMIKSLLQAQGVDYFITNENLNTLYGSADGFTAMDVKVARDKAELAKELLKDII